MVLTNPTETFDDIEIIRNQNKIESQNSTEQKKPYTN